MGEEGDVVPCQLQARPVQLIHQLKSVGIFSSKKMVKWSGMVCVRTVKEASILYFRGKLVRLMDIGNKMRFYL